MGVGVQTFIQDAGQDTRIRAFGRKPAGGLYTNLPTDGRWMPSHCWRWSNKYTETDGEEAFRTKRERIQAICFVKQGTRLNLGGEKREGPKPSLTGNIET